LNSRLLRIITDRGDSKPDAKQVVVGIKSVLPEFAGAGVSIAIENHDRFRTWELIGIIEEIGSPNVGICLDTANSFGALECPGQIVTALGPYALNVHVKDFTITRIRNGMGFTILGRPAGQGMLDIDMVLRKLAEGGRNPDVVLEQWTPFDSTIEKTAAMEDEWAVIGIAYLKEKIQSMKEDA
jgi:sugar phosphate isomerase/epimerase